MTDHDHAALLAKFEAELVDAKAAVSAAMQRRDSLQQVIAGLRALAGPARHASSGAAQRLPGIEVTPTDNGKRLAAPGPRGREAVRILLSEAYPKALHVT